MNVEGRKDERKSSVRLREISNQRHPEIMIPSYGFQRNGRVVEPQGIRDGPQERDISPGRGDEIDPEWYRGDFR